MSLRKRTMKFGWCLFTKRRVSCASLMNPFEHSRWLKSVLFQSLLDATKFELVIYHIVFVFWWAFESIDGKIILLTMAKPESMNMWVTLRPVNSPLTTVVTKELSPFLAVIDYDKKKMISGGDDVNFVMMFKTIVKVSIILFEACLPFEFFHSH